MRVLLIVDDYWPNSTKVAAKMMHELAIELINNNHSTTVVTPSSNIKKKFEKLSIDKVNVIKFRSGKLKNVNRIIRGINESLLSFRAWKFLKNEFKLNPHELIIFYSPSIFWGYLVKNLKSTWNVKSYMILRDFFPQWAIDSGLIKKKSLITKYFRYFEKINYKSADIIAIQSEKNLDWFKKTSIHKSNLSILYNWAADKPIEYHDNYYRKKYNLEDKVILFYGGNIGYAQNIENIIRLAINLKDEKDAFIFIVGEGDEFSLINKRIHENKLNNVMLLPSVNQTEYKKNAYRI